MVLTVIGAEPCFTGVLTAAVWCADTGTGIGVDVETDLGVRVGPGRAGVGVGRGLLELEGLGVGGLLRDARRCSRAASI